MTEAARLLGESLAEEESSARRIAQTARPILDRAITTEEFEVEAETGEEKPKTRKSGGGA